MATADTRTTPFGLGLLCSGRDFHADTAVVVPFRYSLHLVGEDASPMHGGEAQITFYRMAKNILEVNNLNRVTVQRDGDSHDVPWYDDKLHTLAEKSML